MLLYKWLESTHPTKEASVMCNQKQELTDKIFHAGQDAWRENYGTMHTVRCVQSAAGSSGAVSRLPQIVLLAERANPGYVCESYHGLLVAVSPGIVLVQGIRISDDPCPYEGFLLRRMGGFTTRGFVDSSDVSITPPIGEETAWSLRINLSRDTGMVGNIPVARWKDVMQPFLDEFLPT